MTNYEIAVALRDHAARLERTESNLYRVRAFRHAADVVERHAQPLSEIHAEQGRAGIEAIPGIGASIAYTVEGLLRGEWQTLRPEGLASTPAELLTSLPGIGPRWCEHLQERLGVRTVSELREAVRQGRLPEAGLPANRMRAVVEALAQRQHEEEAIHLPADEPPVGDLLEIDTAFREHAREATPRAGGLVWVPFFRVERNGWKYRAHFCRNALAQRMGRTTDWVEVHFTNGLHSGQRIVVTGKTGTREVRGREREALAS